MYQTIITKSIELASKHLLNGEVVAFPTETVFGLGAIIEDETAISKIFQLKKRPADNPLIVHVHNTEQIIHLVEYIPSHAQKIISSFFPAPLTIILKAKKIYLSLSPQIYQQSQ